LSAERETFATRRAALVARAASEREDVARQLAPIATLDGWLERLDVIRDKAPGILAAGALGLSALLIAVPAKVPLVRTGIAAYQLVGSLKTLFTRRR